MGEVWPGTLPWLWLHSVPTFQPAAAGGSSLPYKAAAPASRSALMDLSGSGMGAPGTDDKRQKEGVVAERTQEEKEEQGAG